MVFILNFLTVELRSQDVQFNNINQSLVFLNSSYAGSEGCIRVQSNYRNQWPSLSGSYVTHNTCIDGYIKPIKAGVALSVFSDEVGRGTLRRTHINLSYAQYLKISDDITIIPSVQGSLNKSTLDRGRLNFCDMVDARYGLSWTPNASITGSDVPVSAVKYGNVAAGLIVTHDYWQVGASFANLLEPNIAHLGVYRLPMKTNIHALYKIAMGSRNMVDASFVTTLQGGYYNARFNLVNKCAHGLTYGLGYGVNNNFWIASPATPNTHQTIRGFLGYTGRVFGVQYSYDRYLEFRYPGNTAGSHELSLQIQFKKKGTTSK